MYGLLLANMKDYIVNKYSQKKWDDIKTALKLESDDFGPFAVLMNPNPFGNIFKCHAI